MPLQLVPFLFRFPSQRSSHMSAKRMMIDAILLRMVAFERSGWPKTRVGWVNQVLQAPCTKPEMLRHAGRLPLRREQKWH
jgi:hypothetical protein